MAREWREMKGGKDGYWGKMLAGTLMFVVAFGVQHRLGALLVINGFVREEDMRREG